MPDEAMAPQTKPEDMSFSDWKKLKNALGGRTDTRTSQRDDLKSAKQNNNNNYNTNNNHNLTDFKGPQNVLYFEYLKQNNQRILGGNAGTFNNLSMFNSRHIDSGLNNKQLNCSFPQNNIGSMTPNCNFPQNNRRFIRNMDSDYSSSQNNIGFNGIGANFQDYQTTSDDNFIMSNGGIPQHPFYSNVDRNATRRNSWTPRSQRPMSINRTIERKIVPSIPSKPNDSNETSNGEAKNTVPKAKKKPWIVKPKPPTLNEKPPESKEEKQRMWREYRQQMKPFKNREFHNAKRVIQRLGKKKIDELDEKEKERLTRATETVSTHKSKLAEKTANRWTVLNEMDTSGQTNGQIYVAKPKKTGTYNALKGIAKRQNDSGFDDSLSSAKTNSNELNLWNNFVPGEILQNSTGK